MINKFKIQPWWWTLTLLALGVGLFLRFWNITSNQFLFYDEGMYLGYNRKFLDLVAANPPKDLNELFVILGIMFKTALTTAKALWFFLLNLRVFIFGSEAWYFSRVVSALAGVATIALTYLFSYRYFQSKRIALLSAVFLSLLPSHIFYSRLGMQESFSTLLFLSALYFYLFYKSKNWSAPIAAALLFCVFSTNYRMIIGPIFIVAIEVIEALRNAETINWKRLSVCIAVFGLIVFVIGSLYGGVNRHITFAWMFHQAEEAQGQRNLLNFFSYPAYTFMLEGVLFALLFWANLYLLIKKEWSKMLPFFLVFLQMLGFSFAAEKGARYLCVVLPLMAISAGVAADYFLNFSQKKGYVAALIITTCLLMGIESIKIVNSQTDYANAVLLILKHDPKAGIVSTQPVVEQLYVKDERSVKECPKNLADFVSLYKQGYYYLILDPQSYISWTKDAERFSPPLIDFLQSTHDHVPPVAVLNHLSPVLLKRFVLDHNQNLLQSISFLSEASSQAYGQIRIYDIGQVLMILQQQAIQMSGERQKI